MRFFEDARADYDRAIELDPTLAEAYILRAGAHFALNDLKGAAEDYDRALATELGADAGLLPPRRRPREARRRRRRRRPTGPRGCAANPATS